MQATDLTDNVLVELLRSDDAQAFEVIYYRYWRQLFGFVYQQIGSKEDTEEIVQELMLCLWQNRERSQIRNLNAFLFIAARNLVNRYFRTRINLRKYHEYQLMREVFENIDTDEIFNERQLSESIEKALQHMSEKTAKIFRMSKMDDLSVKVIASRMGLSDKAVEYHITKSLKMIRQHLERFNSDN